MQHLMSSDACVMHFKYERYLLFFYVVMEQLVTWVHDKFYVRLRTCVWGFQSSSDYLYRSIANTNVSCKCILTYKK